MNAAHLAWSDRDLERMLQLFCEDIVYTCNSEPDGEPMRLVGRDAMRGFLLPVLHVAESASVVETFTFDGTVARTRVGSFVKHKKTHFAVSGHFRQVFQFRGKRVSQLDEFHDAAILKVFWRLVEQSEKQALEPDASDI